MAQILVEGRLIYKVIIEGNGIRVSFAEVKPVEYLLEGNPPPPEGWEINQELGVATGPMWTLGTEVQAFISAEMADELGDALKGAVVKKRQRDEFRPT